MNIFPRYFFALVIICISLIVGYRFHQYMVERNFVIEVNTTCDSKVENCFSASEDLSFGQNPYKKVKIIAHYAPKCLEEHNCESFTCPNDVGNSSECEITYCSNDTKVDGEECLMGK